MKTLRSITLALLFALAFAVPALAQTPLSLSVRKDYGYDLGGQIRGTFTLTASGPSDLQSVTFLIDGQPIQTVTAAPFKVQIRTSAYPSGPHDLSATAQTASGQALTSNVRRFEFVSAQQEQTGMGGIFIALFGLVAVLLVVMVGSQVFAYRKRKLEPVPLGAQRNYGLRGGAICPRCGRPTPLHFAAMNLGINTKLDTCENCGYFGILHGKPMAELRQAEAAELKEAQAQTPIPEATPEEKLKQQIDSSRYEDLK